MFNLIPTHFRGEHKVKVIHFFGSRVVKTGVAVFLTAFICQLLNWPPVFAVITAIVTIEPTVSDSIKKGIIRFPASVIGSAYAVFFIALFGNSPITYTLAAVLTILTCYKLNLQVGLLVATLTAVAMVEVIHSNYFLAFLIRLGTTTIGLLVSTGVNMFVFPPDYTKDIIGNIQSIKRQTGILLEKTFWFILNNQKNSRVEQMRLEKHYLEINKTETLIRFQNDESKYHPLVGHEKEQFQKAESQLGLLRMLHYHVNNLNRMVFDEMTWTKPEKDLIMLAVMDLGGALQNKKYYDSEKHQEQLKKLTTIFWGENEAVVKKSNTDPRTFPPELIILYELVAIYNLVDQFYQ